MSSLQSLSDLFREKLYRIPDYQRGYSWGKLQWEQLWEDLMYLEEGKNHYTGLLTVKPKAESPLTGYQAYEVVDGQQRLTTCIILLNEIILRAEQINPQNPVVGSMPVRDIRSKFISGKARPTDLYKIYFLEYTDDDNAIRFFRHYILEDSIEGEQQKTLYTGNLLGAKHFYAERVRELSEKDDNGAQQLASLFHKLTDQLKFNFFEIEDEYVVYEAFETMNNRGKPLSELEIIKNRLIYLTTLYNSQQLPLSDAKQLRKSINDTWKEIYTQLGQDLKAALSDDDYLRDHWMIYYRYVRRGENCFQYLQRVFSKNAVFNHKQRHIAVQSEYDPDNPENNDLTQIDVTDDPGDDILTPKEIDDYVVSLRSAVSSWYYTYHPEQCPDMEQEERIWLEKLYRIGLSYFRPLVTVVILQRNKTLLVDRLALYQAIERFVFIYFRMANYRFDYQSTVYRQAAFDLYRGNTSLNQITENLRNVTEQDCKGCIGYFVNYINRQFDSGDGYYAWPQLRYFMFEYESELAKKRHNNKLQWETLATVMNGDITIEHIFPQTPTDDYWTERFGQYKDKEKKTLAGSIGNLIPLQKSINSKLQNRDFPTKQKDYREGCNSETDVAAYSEWGPKQIYDRGLKLLDFMSERWGLDFSDEQKKQLLNIELIQKGNSID